MLGYIRPDSATSGLSIRACLEIIHASLRGPKHENLYLQPIAVRLRGLFGVFAGQEHLHRNATVANEGKGRRCPSVGIGARRHFDYVNLLRGFRCSPSTCV